MVKRQFGYNTLELCIGVIFVLVLLVGMMEIATWMRARGAVKVAVNEAVKEYARIANTVDMDKSREDRSKEKVINSLKVFFPQINSYCTPEYVNLPCLEISFVESAGGGTGQTRRQVRATVSIAVKRRIFNFLDTFNPYGPSWSIFKASASDVRSLEEEQFSSKEDFNSVHSTD